MCGDSAISATDVAGGKGQSGNLRRILVSTYWFTDIVANALVPIRTVIQTARLRIAKPLISERRFSFQSEGILLRENGFFVRNRRVANGE
jgi:hypothetical protein